MKKLLLIAAAFLGISTGSAFAACTSPAVMHDFPGTAFNMSLVTNTADGNCASVNAIASWGGVQLGAATAYGTAPTGIVPGVNAFVTNPVAVTGAFWQTTQPISAASGTIVDGADVAQGHVADTACPSSGTATVVGCVRAAVVALGSPGAISQTTDGTTNGVRQTSQYPSGATAVQGSTTGTTAATATTLAATASVTNYVCQISIRANATAAATGNATLSDGTKTYNFTQWTAPAASGLGVVEEIFNPCYPASAVNTAWTLTSAAPGTGGVVSVAISGYQK